ncbi:E3 ubiquitin-protein ligase WAV3-like [Andrographis paniculata]|uniref:E3 ubiquitin-protein ligase WAV3-like n=1 Tax=Andrographis paniculata TaxID=175694 RepID=UPI0021E8A25E|nr:E3 ubiquitin-protein ligase WAV3-like [Andrographis paniculata]
MDSASEKQEEAMASASQKQETSMASASEKKQAATAPSSVKEKDVDMDSASGRPEDPLKPEPPITDSASDISEVATDSAPQAHEVIHISSASDEDKEVEICPPPRSQDVITPDQSQTDNLVVELGNQDSGGSFSDDEPLPEPDLGPASQPEATQQEKFHVTAIPEYPEVSRTQPHPTIAVLVTLTAPSMSQFPNSLKRLPLDLVVVLDISKSEDESRLEHMKNALLFIVESMTSWDRLSIVSEATRLTPLRRMHQPGKETAKTAIRALFSIEASTGIQETLLKGARVLDERRFTNPTASIILLSDRGAGHSTEPESTTKTKSQTAILLNLLPESIYPDTRWTSDLDSFPVHSFGIGPCHDPSVLHAVSSASLGTYSYVKSYDILQDAVACCIAGLTSVTVQNVHITLAQMVDVVKIRSIESGLHASRVSQAGDTGEIIIGEMYAEEVKEFRVEISLPRLTILGKRGATKRTRMGIMWSYSDAVWEVHEKCLSFEVQRPIDVSPEGSTQCEEILQNKARLFGAESIRKVRLMADHPGELYNARNFLLEKLAEMSQKIESGHGPSVWIYGEMCEVAKLLGSLQLYERFGQAYALSNVSSHDNQRATTRGCNVPGVVAISYPAYATPHMVRSVNSSRSQRHKLWENIRNIF